jgi:hypothetical protein
MADHDSFRPITIEQRLTLPLNGTIYTTTRVVAAEKGAPKLGETMVNELGSTWTDSLVVATSHVPDSAKRQLTITHARISTEAEQLASNWEWQEVSTSVGQLKGVARTFIYLTSAFSQSSPALGSSMPIYAGSTVPVSAVTANFIAGDGYVLFSRDVASSGTQLEPVFRVERRVYIKRKIVRSIGVDSTNGKPLYATVELRHRDEVQSGTPPTAVTYGALLADPANAFWGVQADGTQRTARPATDEWIEITTEQLVSGTFVSDVVTLQTYNTIQNFYWPPVLATGSLEFSSWVRRDGGADIYPSYKYTNDGYDGPCYSLITRTWKKTPFTIIPPVQMLPTPVNYASPFFNINIPACLHGEVECVCLTGSEDPIYVYGTGNAKTTDATNVTAWPDTIIAADSQEPYKGGYLRTVITITKPSYTPPSP